MKNLSRLPCYSMHSQRQLGFTLVEIMIAITIGLLMLAGILQISAASKESGRLQRNMSFVQENIRTSMEILGRDIRQAGYYEDDDPAAPISTAPSPFVAATTIDGGGANNDQITVTYESGKDCLQQDTPVVSGNQFAVNHYYIEDERLMCDGNGGSPKPLVEGVESMQILYGENTDGNPLSANRYVLPGELDDFNNVVSVRISMRFHSREHVRQGIDNNLYALLDANPWKPATGDKRIRREVTSTFLVRNSMLTK